MTIRARNRVFVAGIVMGVAALLASLLPTLPMLASSDSGAARDVDIVIRDMAFYLDGKGEPNPTLVFRSGERVRVFVRSEDAGMDHDFVVKTWKVQSNTLTGRGETSVTIKVPRAAGTESYFCTPHATRMRGTIRVE
ncbi:MAG: plastocyanin/azurin family copper-binding protein [Vicinamibacterales bacterium]